jgi:hypothetical protein
MASEVHAHFWTDDYLDKIAALGNNDTAAQRGQGAGGRRRTGCPARACIKGWAIQLR